VPSTRAHFQVTIDGRTHDIVTNAHDWADMAPGETPTLGIIYQVMWRACVRLGVPGCPHTYSGFLDVLDGFDTDTADTNGQVGPGDLDPTGPAPSAISPSSVP
jgi:hypothetical protein